MDSLSKGLTPGSELTPEELAQMLESGFRASASPTVLEECEVVVFALPTPIGSDFSPDLNPLMQGITSAARVLKSKQLWIIESTIAPGTIESHVIPALKSLGLKHGRDFLLAHSPERVNPGPGKSESTSIPKIVAGLSSESRDAAVWFYEDAEFPVIVAESIDAAASAKLLENTYRAVNTALINEITPLLRRQGVDPLEVIRLASTKPFGFHAFWPGPGVGGHCIPVDPWYLVHSLDRGGSGMSVVTAALKANIAMPLEVANRIREILETNPLYSESSAVLLCGMTYKANVSDFRNSPGPKVAEALASRGISLSYHDPYISRPIPELSHLKWSAKLAVDTRGYNFIFVLQEHDIYRSFPPSTRETQIFTASASSAHLRKSIWAHSSMPNQLDLIHDHISSQ